MNDQSKHLTKVAITYHPPTFKFEYTKESTNAKYHKRVDLETFIRSRKNEKCDRWPSSISVTGNTELSHDITEALIQRYRELLQIPSPKIECLIQKLLTTNSTCSSERETVMSNKKCTNVEPMQVNMSINNGSLLVSPLRERPKLQRQTASYVFEKEPNLLSAIGDLNQASEQELAVAKNKMNEVFEKCQLLPGDVEYLYDKRVDFEEPDEESSWD